MKKGKVTEVFFSLQGEGPYLGTPHVFVRFAGCDLSCRYCDTQAKKFKEYSAVELARICKKLFNKHNASYLSLTGGEPLLQADFITEFLKKINRKKIFVYLETNGILYQKFKIINKQVDIIALDIKLPSATGVNAFWEEHKSFLKLCKGKNAFVKAIITLSTTTADARKFIRLVGSINKNMTVILQPNSSEISKKLIQKIGKIQLLAGYSLSDVRIIPQMHKWLNIR